MFHASHFTRRILNKKPLWLFREVACVLCGQHDWLPLICQLLLELSELAPAVERWLLRLHRADPFTSLNEYCMKLSRTLY